MTNSTPIDERFEQILSARSQEVATLARRVRDLVRETLPDAVEVPNHGQEGIGFGINQYGHDGWGVGVIGVARNWVTLGFMRGAQLPDPHGIVEGTGRNVRHVKVRSAQAFEERREALVALLKAASNTLPVAVQGALNLDTPDEPVRHSALAAERSVTGRTAQKERLADQAASMPPVVATVPVATKSAAKKPVAKKPVAKKPAATKPAAKKPAAKKPAAKKPAAKKPAAKKPAAKKPATKKPLAKKPATKKPATKKPVAKKPAAKKPATKKPTAKKPVAKKPATKKPAAKKPAAKKPVAKKPAAKRPAAKRPAAKRPAAKRPAARKPARR